MYTLLFLFFGRTGLKRLHKKELITSEECRSLVRSSFAGILSLQLKKSADVRQKTVEELPWRILGGITDTILMQKFECKCIACHISRACLQLYTDDWHRLRVVTV